MFKVINLCQHDIVLVDQDGNLIKCYPASGTVARVSTFDGVDLSDLNLPFPAKGASGRGEVTGLPPQVSPDGNGEWDNEGNFWPNPTPLYLVSLQVAQAAQRTDVFSPGTGPNDNPLRNDRGQVEAVRCFVRSC